jgi:hypothetical protein
MPPGLNLLGFGPRPDARVGDHLHSCRIAAAGRVPSDRLGEPRIGLQPSRGHGIVGGLRRIGAAAAGPHCAGPSLFFGEQMVRIRIFRTSITSDFRALNRSILTKTCTLIVGLAVLT